MKLKLFQYAVLLHPVEKKDEVNEEKSQIIVDLKSTLSLDEKAVVIKASREIPEKYLENLDRIEIIVRSF